MGTQMGGEKLPKTTLILIGLPLGPPGKPKTTKMEPKGANMTPGDPKIEALGTSGGGVGRSQWIYYMLYIYILYIMHIIYYIIYYILYDPSVRP